MKTKWMALAFCSLSLTQFSCNHDDTDKARQWNGDVLIVNEGPFQTGTGTVDAYLSSSGQLQSDVYGTVNGRPLGNIVQSLTVFQDRIYIVINNAGRVEVADYFTFGSIGVIEPLTLPRYFIASPEGKGYVSCWDKTIRVINLSSLELTGSIPTGSGPDEMAIAGGRLFVINSGGFGTDSTVTVIDMISNEVIATLEVGHRPVGISQDQDGVLWVLCSGKGWNGFPAAGDSQGKLVKIDPQTLEMAVEAEFGNPGIHPDNLAMAEGGMKFFFNMPDGIHFYDAVQQSFSNGPFVPRHSMFYGLGLDKLNGTMYAADPVDYVQNGWVFRFRASDGEAIDSFRVGVVPGSFWFEH